jgi:hypothetical protein
MSDSKKVWMILWNRAVADPTPFEISEAAPEAASVLKMTVPAAMHKIAFVLQELSRIPDGGQYFIREGDAVVPLPEFMGSEKDPDTAEAAYPFED